MAKKPHKPADDPRYPLLAPPIPFAESQYPDSPPFRAIAVANILADRMGVLLVMLDLEGRANGQRTPPPEGVTAAYHNSIAHCVAEFNRDYALLDKFHREAALKPIAKVHGIGGVSVSGMTAPTCADLVLQMADKMSAFLWLATVGGNERPKHATATPIPVDPGEVLSNLQFAATVLSGAKWPEWDCVATVLEREADELLERETLAVSGTRAPPGKPGRPTDDHVRAQAELANELRIPDANGKQRSWKEVARLVNERFGLTGADAVDADTIRNRHRQYYGDKSGSKTRE